MSVFLECKKIKRTGFLPAFSAGALLAAAVPAVNMAARAQVYLTQPDSPVSILLRANWQMMAMLNVLLVSSGACFLYHTEYADNALQKMKSLPLRESQIFFGKVLLTIIIFAAALTVEAGAVAFCSCHWFKSEADFGIELCKSFGYAFLLMLPCIILSILIAEACKNMWVSLGIGVVCTFIATMLPTDHFILSLFPFAMPFQTLSGTGPAGAAAYIIAVEAELAAFFLAKLLWIRARRCFE